jgi:hypothetical protein
MRNLSLRAGVTAGLLCVLSALMATGAAARPGSGPRETVDQRFTTARPGAPTGVDYSARYHAPGDESASPPTLQRIVVEPPRGTRYDTGVPDLCEASDVELQMRGPAACPDGSRLGDGTTEGLLLAPLADDFVIDHFKHNVYVLNNTNEQIVLVESEGFTVVRGRVEPNGTVVWEPTTCFPPLPAGGCADDNIIQLATTTLLPPYTTTAPDGDIRSYTTTPPRCPKRGHWRTKVGFWWADGSVDRVVTTQACKRSS